MKLTKDHKFFCIFSNIFIKDFTFDNQNYLDLVQIIIFVTQNFEDESA
jgi:hypothetical protein